MNVTAHPTGVLPRILRSLERTNPRLAGVCGCDVGKKGSAVSALLAVAPSEIFGPVYSSCCRGPPKLASFELAYRATEALALVDCVPWRHACVHDGGEGHQEEGGRKCGVVFERAVRQRTNRTNHGKQRTWEHGHRFPYLPQLHNVPACGGWNNPPMLRSSVRARMQCARDGSRA